MNCAILGGLSFTTVYVSGPFNGWSADANPLSDADGDGIWEGTYDLLAGDIEYKYQVDMWADQEDLIDDMVNGGTCAPVTDYWSFANRLATNGPGGFVTDDNYGSCDDCDPAALAGCTDATADNYDAAAISDNGSCLYTMTFEVDMNCAGFTPGVVFLTGPADGWSGSSYQMDDADGDGVWTGTFQISAPFEYIYSADYWAQSETAGLINAMVNGGTCAPNTDYFSYANRMITAPVGGSTVSETWGSCDACVPAVLGCTDPNADNYDSSADTDDGSCTYCSTFALSIDSQSDASASGASDGTAVVSGSGGTSPYSISWPADPNALSAGTYTVTATDAAGCTASIDVTIDEPTAVTNSTLISDCDDFVSGPAAWPYILVATTVADGAASQAAQTFTMNITSLPAGGANVQVYKTTANGGDFFATPVALTLGSNSITVPAVSFDRAVKFRFSSGDVEFDALSLNGVDSECNALTPPSPVSLISDCDDFVSGPVAWPYVLVATTVADGAASQAAQTFTMNVTSLPSGGANFRAIKTTANGNWFNGPAQALTLGSNSITVPAVTFDRAVKFQFSSGDVEFDALSLNGVDSECLGATAQMLMLTITMLQQHKTMVLVHTLY